MERNHRLPRPTAIPLAAFLALALSACGHARHAAGPAFAAPGDTEPPPSETWAGGGSGGAGGERQWIDPPAAAPKPKPEPAPEPAPEPEFETETATPTPTSTSTPTATAISTATPTAIDPDLEPIPPPAEPHSRHRRSGAARGALAATKWLWVGTLYVILQTGPAAPILVSALVYFWPYTLGVTAGVAAIGALVGAAAEGHPAGSTPTEGDPVVPGSAGPEPAGEATPGSVPY